MKRAPNVAIETMQFVILPQLIFVLQIGENGSQSFGHAGRKRTRKPRQVTWL